MSQKITIQQLPYAIETFPFTKAACCVASSCILASYHETPSIAWISNSNLVSNGEILVDSKYNRWLQKSPLRAEWPFAVCLFRENASPASSVVLFLYHLAEKSYRTYEVPSDAQMALMMGYERAVVVLKEAFFFIDLFATELETAMIPAKPLQRILPSLCISRTQEILLASMSDIQIWKFDCSAQGVDNVTVEQIYSTHVGGFGYSEVAWHDCNIAAVSEGGSMLHIYDYSIDDDASDEENQLPQAVPVTKIFLDDEYLLAGLADGTIKVYGISRHVLLGQINMSPMAVHGSSNIQAKGIQSSHLLQYRISFLFRWKDYVISSMLDPTSSDPESKRLELSIWALKGHNSVQPLKSRLITNGNVLLLQYDITSQSMLILTQKKIDVNDSPSSPKSNESLQPTSYSPASPMFVIWKLDQKNLSNAASKWKLSNELLQSKLAQEIMNDVLLETNFFRGLFQLENIRSIEAQSVAQAMLSFLSEYPSSRKAFIDVAIDEECERKKLWIQDPSKMRFGPRSSLPLPVVAPSQFRIRSFSASSNSPRSNSSPRLSSTYTLSNAYKTYMDSPSGSPGSSAPLGSPHSDFSSIGSSPKSFSPRISSQYYVVGISDKESSLLNSDDQSDSSADLPFGKPSLGNSDSSMEGVIPLSINPAPTFLYWIDGTMTTCAISQYLIETGHLFAFLVLGIPLQLLNKSEGQYHFMIPTSSSLTKQEKDSFKRLSKIVATIIDGFIEHEARLPSSFLNILTKIHNNMLADLPDVPEHQVFKAGVGKLFITYFLLPFWFDPVGLNLSSKISPGIFANLTAVARLLELVCLGSHKDVEHTVLAPFMLKYRSRFWSWMVGKLHHPDKHYGIDAPKTKTMVNSGKGLFSRLYISPKSANLVVTQFIIAHSKDLLKIMGVHEHGAAPDACAARVRTISESLLIPIVSLMAKESNKDQALAEILEIFSDADADSEATCFPFLPSYQHKIYDELEKQTFSSVPNSPTSTGSSSSYIDSARGSANREAITRASSGPVSSTSPLSLTSPSIVNSRRQKSETISSLPGSSIDLFSRPQLQPQLSEPNNLSAEYQITSPRTHDDSSLTLRKKLKRANERFYHVTKSSAFIVSRPSDSTVKRSSTTSKDDIEVDTQKPNKRSSKSKTGPIDQL